MENKPRLLDDIAGLAGGAFSAALGVREEIHAIIRTQLDEVFRSLKLERKENVDILRDMTAKARQVQQAQETTLHAMQKRIDALETDVKHLKEAQK